MHENQESASIRHLTIGEVGRVVALQDTVSAGLPAGFLRPKTEETLRAYVDGTLGAAYGVFERGTLVACALLRIPTASDPNPNPGMPFPHVPPADWPLHACFLENALVAPAARGRGYQRALLGRRVFHARAAGMRWICAGVHLGNTASWSNLLAGGMVIAGIRFDCGYPMIGMLRPLHPFALPTRAGDQLVINRHDELRHEMALGAGYVGVRLAPERAIVYQRLWHA